MASNNIYTKITPKQKLIIIECFDNTLKELNVNTEDSSIMKKRMCDLIKENIKNDHPESLLLELKHHIKQCGGCLD